MPFKLQKHKRITRSGEYRLVYQEGEKIAGKYLLLFHRGTGGAGTRVGITVSGKVGIACARNRARRRIREALNLELEGLGPGMELVFVATRRIKTASFEDIRRDIMGLLKRSKG